MVTIGGPNEQAYRRDREQRLWDEAQQSYAAYRAEVVAATIHAWRTDHDPGDEDPVR